MLNLSVEIKLNQQQKNGINKIIEIRFIYKLTLLTIATELVI